MRDNEKKIDWLKTSALALIYEIGLQFVIGIILAIQYSSGSQGYQSVVHIRSTWIGSFISGIHYWGSSMLILHSLFQVTATLWTSKYRESTLQWIGAIVIFIGAVIAQITGNILPMDRHGVQTVVIETGLMGSVPIVGHLTRAFAAGGQALTPATGTLWFHLHEFLVTVILLFGIFLLLKNRDQKRESISKFGAWVPIIVLTLVALAVKPPLGDPAQKADYSQYDAHVSWYTWPMHGMMQVFDKISSSAGWIGFAIVPGSFIAFLLLTPWLDKKIKKIGVQGIFCFYAIAFLTAGFLFGGPIAALTGNRDPAPIEIASGKTRKIAPPNQSTLALMVAGKSLFNNSVGCSGCHGENGANGTSGPDLTALWKLHNSAWFQKYVHDPRSVNPSSTMPSFNTLSVTQLSQIAAFLSHPQTGK